MTEQYQRFVEAGAEVLAVVYDSMERARQYFSDHNIPFMCLIDSNREVFDRYQVDNKLISLGQRPGLFIIDREGVVQFAHVGWQQWEIPDDSLVLEVCEDVGCKGPS